MCLGWSERREAPHGRYIWDFSLLSYVRRGLCDPFFFSFGVHYTQYKVHAQRSPHNTVHSSSSGIDEGVELEFGSVCVCLGSGIGEGGAW